MLIALAINRSYDRLEIEVSYEIHHLAPCKLHQNRKDKVISRSV